MKRKPITQTEEEKLYDAAYPIIMAPWHGIFTPVRLRKLSPVQAKSCGDFGMIELPEDRMRMDTVSVEDVAKYAKMQDAICKLSMVKPTYDEALKIAGAHIDSKSIDAQLEGIEQAFRALEGNKTADPKELLKLRNAYAAIEIQSKFILPEDFMAWVTNYSNEIAQSDIKRVTKEMLLEAAILASRGNKRPSEILQGLFTPLMQIEIDNRAWIILDEDQKQKKGA